MHDTDVATKADVDLQRTEVRADTNGLRDEISQLEQRIDKRLESFATKDGLESMKDQITQAFQMTEENVRKDSTHIDEFADLNGRVTKLEHEVSVLSRRN